ncbi:beta-lactamase-like protein [Aspergillus caelatus]|uniref:Beta-lactamase-like protein n=1 Tax=Aspergillus caelatus TaxID=61420 RepID=A0A5N7A433_9EURO|nr:beta-lactamase-like protein [Aspergillus caelatus]KAE8364617.1 beta-lactamase-like protein [Aspergillus caelatus]
MSQDQLFEIPPGETITVKLINPVNFGPSHLKRFMTPQVPGLDTFASNPAFSFLLEHTSGRKLIFDLGIRKDYQNYAPKIANYIPTTGYNIEVTHNVADILQEHGIPLKEIEAVIWSHWHWDHIGDPSTFPPTTNLIVGPGFKEALLPGAPTNPDSPILESDYTGRTLREITFEPDTPQTLQIGQFPAFDYFGDGSFYLLDSPGHAIGHLCGLARTTRNPDTFVLLGGDIAHYTGIFRPSKHRPIPDSIAANADAWAAFKLDVGFCLGSAWEELQASRGRQKEDSLFDPTFGHNVPLAIETVKKLQEIDCDEDVFVVIAHDFAVRDGVAHFPEALNEWKARGWGRQLRWAFLKQLEGYWREKGLSNS